MVPIETLPGLPSALLDLVRPTLARDSETSRRQLEAALALRNLALEGGQRCLDAIRPIVHQIYQVLTECLESDHQAVELILYMLDLAEVYASSFKLLLASDTLQSRLQQSSQQQVYPLLAKLAQSNDRALVIGAYTLLGALAMNEQSEPVFALRHQPPLFPHSALHLFQPSLDPTELLVKRALLLLPLNDSDLLLPILEFLYQHTLIPSNASFILLRQDFRDILRLFASRIKEGATEETIEYEIHDRSNPASAGIRKLRGKMLREALVATYPTLAAQAQLNRSKTSEPFDAKLDDIAIQRILYLPEPQRVKEWMHAVFEFSTTGEITQVALWKAYQKQFDRFEAQMKSGQIPGMLNASDVIKTSSEAFPEAQPRVVEDPSNTHGRRFVISGIRMRQRPASADDSADDLKNRWRCMWTACTNKTVFASGDELYRHLSSAHGEVGDKISSPATCQYAVCKQIVRDSRDLLWHLRTHILPSAPPQASGPTSQVNAADALDRSNTYFYEKTMQAQVGDGGYAAGIGFLASLVMRNCARAVANAAGAYLKKRLENEGRTEDIQEGPTWNGEGQSRVRYAGQEAHMSVDDDRERVRMARFLAGTLIDDQVEDASVPDMPKEASLDKPQLAGALGALLGVQKDIIALAATSQHLAPYLMETLECMEVAKKAAEGTL